MDDLLDILELFERLNRDNFDTNLHNRCISAQNLAHRGEMQQAIVLIGDIIRAAAWSSNSTKDNSSEDIKLHTTQGMVFLYAAYIRHLAGETQRNAAYLDGETANKWLKMDQHNLAIARLVQARILLEDDKSLEAIEHYRQASTTLAELIENCIRTRQERKQRDYEILQRSVKDVLEQIQFSKLSASQPDNTLPLPSRPPIRKIPQETSAAPRVSQPPKHPVLLRGLEHTHLIWPEPEPVSWEPIPREDESKTIAQKDTPIDYAEINQVSLNGRAYLIEPVYSDQGCFRAQAGQSYISLQIADDAEEAYVLVKQQAHSAEGPEQAFVVMSSNPKRVWITMDLPDPDEKIIGERHWDYSDESQITIIGLVEAILKPAKEDIQREQTLRTDGLSTTIEFGTNTIIPRQTFFDPRLGHIADGCIDDPDLEDGIIIKATPDPASGKIRVVVNKRGCQS
jgi:hypothetical protein